MNENNPVQGRMVDYNTPYPSTETIVVCPKHGQTPARLTLNGDVFCIKCINERIIQFNGAYSIGPGFFQGTSKLPPTIGEIEND
jgi:hypothetical protein